LVFDSRRQNFSVITQEPFKNAWDEVLAQEESTDQVTTDFTGERKSVREKLGLSEATLMSDKRFPESKAESNCTAGSIWKKLHGVEVTPTGYKPSASLVTRSELGRLRNDADVRRRLGPGSKVGDHNNSCASLIVQTERFDFADIPPDPISS
jgi:hypothetical protein